MNDMIRKLEGRLVSLFAPLPHFPMKVSVWLRDNAWWLVLVGLVLSIGGIIYTIGVLTGAAYVAGPYIQAAMAYGYTVSLLAIVSGWISILSLVAMLVLEGMAVGPLRQKQKKGWDLLFIVSLLSLATSIVTALLTVNIGSLVGALIGGAIGLYILFEIRAAYVAKVGEKAKPAEAAGKAPEFTPRA